jgi:O-antigen ligase
MNFGLWLINGDRDVGTSAETGSGSPIALLLWNLCYLIGVVGLMRDRKRAWELLRPCLPLVLIIAFIATSSIWADQPFVTARRAVEYFGECSLAFFIAMRLGLRGFVETLGIAITISAVFSVLLLVLVPSIGFQSYAFAGFFVNKNGLGPAMVIGMITVICAMEKARGRLRTLKYGILAVFTVLLIGSVNGSGLVSALVLCVVTAALMRSRASRSPRLVVYCAVPLAVIAFFSSLSGFGADDILGLFGRDATLTGRTELWQAIGEAMQDRPIFGYGFASFWGLDGPAARLVYPVVAWTPESSHNGFIEVELGMGVVGEGLLLLLLGVTLWRSWRMFWLADDWLSAWPLLTTLYVILSNLAGATFTSVGNSVDLTALIASLLFATQFTARDRSTVRKRNFTRRPLRRAGRSALTSQI